MTAVEAISPDVWTAAVCLFALWTVLAAAAFVRAISKPRR
jgi:hypothetical protein